MTPNEILDPPIRQFEKGELTYEQAQEKLVALMKEHQLEHLAYFVWMELASARILKEEGKL